MMAPASGFYTTPGGGKNEVRVAYVLKKEDLVRALFILRKALEAYPGGWRMMSNWKFLLPDGFTVAGKERKKYQNRPYALRWPVLLSDWP